jgi:hypothetical protein
MQRPWFINQQMAMGLTLGSERTKPIVRLDYSAGSFNTRIIARCERERERYFAYATALRAASGSAYQIGPYRNRSLIRSMPSLPLRGRIS